MSQMKDAEKRVLRLRTKNARQGIKGPFDCPICESFNSVEVRIGKGVTKIKCFRCEAGEIIPEVGWMLPVDYFSIAADKWLSNINGTDWEEPTFNITYVPHKDKKKLLLLKNITIGILVMFVKNKPSEPHRLEDIILPETKHAGKESIIPWDDVIEKIQQSGEFYSAKEVARIFCEDKVKPYRVKTVLDKAVDSNRLSRVMSKRTWWYGRKLS